MKDTICYRALWAPNIRIQYDRPIYMLIGNISKVDATPMSIGGLQRVCSITCNGWVQKYAPAKTCTYWHEGKAASTWERGIVRGEMLWLLNWGGEARGRVGREGSD